MSRFASMKAEARDGAALPAKPLDVSALATGRKGKKAISGYFSPEASRALHLLALELDVSLQALMGEAFDDLMRKYGRHPFGER